MSMAGIWFLHGKRNPRQSKARRAAHARLIRMLAHDGQHRRPPPITLPGQSTSNGSVDPPAPEPPEQWTGGWSELHVAPRATAGEHSRPKPNDGNGPYSRGELLSMNRRFIGAVERAFASGTESRAAARATITVCTTQGLTGYTRDVIGAPRESRT